MTELLSPTASATARAGAMAMARVTMILAHGETLDKSHEFRYAE